MQDGAEEDGEAGAVGVGEEACYWALLVRVSVKMVEGRENCWGRKEGRRFGRGERMVGRSLKVGDGW